MNRKYAQFCVVCSVAMICAQAAIAQTATSTPPRAGQTATEAGMLTRTQWLKKIGDAAKDASVKKEDDKKNAEVAREVLKQVPAGEKVEFTQRLLKAITRLPLSPEEKQAAINKTVMVCIAGTSLKDDERYHVIAEVMAVVPVEYLPSLVGMLSKRFDPKLNKLTTEQFKAMADATVKISVERNKTTDDPAVRNTFTLLLFLLATPPEDTPDLPALLLARLPDDRSRDLAKGWIVEAQKGNFEPLLTAADAAIRVDPPTPAVQRVGVSQMEQLLMEIGGLTGSFGATAQRNGTDVNLPGVGVFSQQDIGIQTVPVPPPVSPCVPCGYPNQLDTLQPRGRQ